MVKRFSTRFLWGPVSARFWGAVLQAKRNEFQSFELQALPMRATWAPSVAQSIATSVARLMRHEAESTGNDISYHITAEAWIDNFVVATDAFDQAEKLWVILKKNLWTFPINFKEYRRDCNQGHYSGNRI